jgi:hypothetical protein
MACIMFHPVVNLAVYNVAVLVGFGCPLPYRYCPPLPHPDDFSTFILPPHPSALHPPPSPSFATGSVDL